VSPYCKRITPQRARVRQQSHFSHPSAALLSSRTRDARLRAFVNSRESLLDHYERMLPPISGSASLRPNHPRFHALHALGAHRFLTVAKLLIQFAAHKLLRELLGSA